MLKVLAVAAVTAATPATAKAVPSFVAPGPKFFSKVMVYRLRTRRTRACHACKLHHRYTVFRTRSIADRNRAHPGCNCPIVVQPLPKHIVRRLFPLGSNGVAHLPRLREDRRA